MCDKELLIAYLYEDLGAADRLQMETHLRGCAVCRAELNALGGVRADLAAWHPPQPDFGWRMVPARRQSWRAWWTPAAGLAAAAVLVLAAASALAHVDMRYGPDGFTLRTGWTASASAPAQRASFGGTVVPSTAPQPASVSGGLDAATAAAFERRIRALETAARAGGRDATVRQASVTTPRLSDAEVASLTKRFTDLLAQSESRQRGELAFHIAQVLHDVDAQRVNDLAEVRRGMGRIDASLTSEAVAHRDLTNYILSAKQK